MMLARHSSSTRLARNGLPSSARCRRHCHVCCVDGNAGDRYRAREEKQGDDEKGGLTVSGAGRRDLFFKASAMAIAMAVPWSDASSPPSVFAAATAAAATGGGGGGVIVVEGVPIAPAVVRPELAPDQRLYDAADPRLRAAARALQDALAAPDVAREEAAWTRIIDEYGGGLLAPGAGGSGSGSGSGSGDAVWAPDVVGRAIGNRGNARARQGRLAEALADYNAAIALCPWSVDPVLNRGVALEAVGRFDAAAADYRAVLAAAPDDPSAWNNLGNAYGGLGQWRDAVDCFGRAAALAPSFAFAAANQALALWQAGDRADATRRMRALLRRYPDFADVRAALAAALWADGLEAEAEAAWARVDDARYRDVNFLKTQRRWPPGLVDAMAAFLRIESVGGGGGGGRPAAAAAV